MRPVLKRASALVGTAVVIASIAAAAPALAASDSGRALPAGDKMFAIACDSFDYPRLQVFSVNPTTAETSTVGAGSEIGETSCAGTAVIDPTTGVTYFVGWDGAAAYLARLDLTTGLATMVSPFVNVTEEPYIEAIAIGLDGKAYAIGQMPDAPNGGIYSLELSTGALGAIAPLEHELDSVVVNPETGAFVGVAPSGEVYALDVADGSMDLSFDLSEVLGLNVATDNLTFDSEGMLWFTAGGLQDNRGIPGPMMQDLWSLDPANPEMSLRLSGTLGSQEAAAPTFVRTEALFIDWADSSDSADEDGVELAAPTPVEVLAETGVDAATPIFVFGALAAALAGAALLVGSSFRRRAT